MSEARQKPAYTITEKAADFLGARPQFVPQLVEEFVHMGEKIGFASHTEKRHFAL